MSLLYEIADDLRLFPMAKLSFYRQIYLIHWSGVSQTCYPVPIAERKVHGSRKKYAN